MESRFPQRVELERRALDVVNSRIQARAPLVGLTHKTVGRWLAGLSDIYSEEFVEELEKVIAVVSEAARAEADISDEIFVDIDVVEADAAITRLQSALIKPE